MKKPQKDRGTDTSQAASLVAVLVLLIVNGQAIAVTMQPACGHGRHSRR